MNTSRLIFATPTSSMRCPAPCRPPLCENFSLAFGRLKSLAARLSCYLQSCVNYDDVIQQQVTVGINEPNPEDKSSTSASVKHYLPHQPIIRPGHATTKACIMYDTSAKPKPTDYCLNECFLRGPCFLPSLCSFLLRCRLIAS